MSLDYKILWIDDNPKLVQSKLNHVAQFLTQEGFRSSIKLIEDGNEVDSYLGDSLLDLIVTDFNIHEDLNGKQLAERVRDSDAIVDIILYSQQRTVDLYEEVGALDGVYISNRDGLEEKIKDVIKITIRRTQNVSNMRGIVISEAIDIERQIEIAIIDYFSDKGELVRDRVLALYDFNKKICMINAIVTNIIKKCNELSSLSDKDKKIFFEKKRQAEAFKRITKTLFLEVGWPRNVLAHTEREDGDDGATYLKSTMKNPDGKKEIIKVDSIWYQKTRKDLQKHSENLQKIVEFLKDWK
jgi:hypothetical protein